MTKETTCENCIYANECIMYEPKMKRCKDYREVVESCAEIKVIPIPPNATNGDMIKAMFPYIYVGVSCDGDVIDVRDLGIYCPSFDTDWWNAPYEGGEEE